MSSEHEPPDDRELDDFLAGRGELSAAYRAAARGEHAPPELDAAILANARTAAQLPPPFQRLHRRPRWLRPVAVAATLVFSLGVMLSLWREPDARRLALPPQPAAPVPASVPAQLESQLESQLDSAAARADADQAPPPRAPAGEEESSAAPVAPAPAAVPDRGQPGSASELSERKRRLDDRERAARQKEAAPAPEMLPDNPDDAATAPSADALPKLEPRRAAARAEADAERRPQADQLEALAPMAKSSAPEPAPAPAPAPAPTPAPAPASAPAPAPAPPLEADARAGPAFGAAAGALSSPASAGFVADPRSKEQWIEQIRAFRQRGDEAAARRELIALRKAHPQFELPPDLRAFALEP